jgi:hypothetical protein
MTFVRIVIPLYLLFEPDLHRIHDEIIAVTFPRTTTSPATPSRRSRRECRLRPGRALRQIKAELEKHRTGDRTRCLIFPNSRLGLRRARRDQGAGRLCLAANVRRSLFLNTAPAQIPAERRRIAFKATRPCEGDPDREKNHDKRNTKSKPQHMVSAFPSPSSPPPNHLSCE